jgi:hypothetical protein
VDVVDLGDYADSVVLHGYYSKLRHLRCEPYLNRAGVLRVAAREVQIHEAEGDLAWRLLTEKVPETKHLHQTESELDGVAEVIRDASHYLDESRPVASAL